VPDGYWQIIHKLLLEEKTGSIYQLFLQRGRKKIPPWGGMQVVGTYSLVKK
jgi:hypothetical protein